MKNNVTKEVLSCKPGADCIGNRKWDFFFVTPGLEYTIMFMNSAWSTEIMDESESTNSH